jgi:hypothetical protein
MSNGGVESQSVEIPGVLVADTPHGSDVSAAAPLDAANGGSTTTPPPSVEAAATPVTEPVTEPVAETVAEPVAEPVETKKPAARASGMAAGGQPVGTPGPPPGAPVWPQPMSADESYIPNEEFDVSDLGEVNRQLNMARARIFRVSQTLKLAQRTLADAQSDYDRAMRRQLVSISGGTSESRRAMAEINCEHLENRIIVGKQVVEEWRKRSMDTRDDLKAIENIAHNVRAQIDIR